MGCQARKGRKEIRRKEAEYERSCQNLYNTSPNAEVKKLYAQNNLFCAWCVRLLGLLPQAAFLLLLQNQDSFKDRHWAGLVNSANVKESKTSGLLMIARGCEVSALIWAFISQDSPSNLNSNTENVSEKAKLGGVLQVNGWWFDEMSGSLRSHRIIRSQWYAMCKYGAIDFRALSKAQHRRDWTNI